MKSPLLLGVCSMFLLAGCGKKHDAAGPAPAPGAETSPAAAPTVAQAGAAAAPAAGDSASASTETLTPLTQALRKYYFEHRQVPPTFEEFATAARIQVPQAPAGKKFAINRKNLEVVLVDR